MNNITDTHKFCFVIQKIINNLFSNFFNIIFFRKTSQLKNFIPIIHKRNRYVNMKKMKKEKEKEKRKEKKKQQ